MNLEKYNTLKNALIVDANDKLLVEFKKLMIALDKEQNESYSNAYQKYDYMSLTVEEEEEKIANIIDLIKKREQEHNEFEDDYSYITGIAPDFLSQVLYIDRLKELEQRLSTIREYLVIKERIVNLSVNIKDYKRQLAISSDNRRLQTKLNKSTKKVNDLLNSLKKENILILLYEFCIIDTFDKSKVNNGEMLKNILSSKVKKKEEQVKELQKEENKIKEERLEKVDGLKREALKSSNEEERIVNKEDVQEKSIEVNDKESVKVDVYVNDSSSNDDDDYIRRMIPEGMPILEQIGTVRPVSMMERLEKAQEEEKDLTIPSMGMLDNQDSVEIDSNDYLKNTQKSDKIS